MKLFEKQHSNNKKTARRRLLKSGRADRIRTCDLFVPNEARYQPALQLVVGGAAKSKVERWVCPVFLFATALLVVIRCRGYDGYAGAAV